MEFFCFHRDRPGCGALRGELVEEHWSYMDRYAEQLIAYGPLLSEDGAAWLGTAALLRAPDSDAARALLTAGRYAAIEVHAWQFGGRR